MRIYVDFDDVLGETANMLSTLARDLFGRHVPFEDIRAFDLSVSFGLDRVQYERLMAAAHSAEVLLALHEIPGASRTLLKWMEAGHEVEVVTGRPFSTAAPSRAWLETHGLGAVPVLHVDKYHREPPPPSPDAPRALTVEEFCGREYDFAVEDSPVAFGHLGRIPGCRVAVFARPWNADAPMPSPLFRRCAGWDGVEAYFGEAGRASTMA